jgi:hypothetical protein
MKRPSWALMMAAVAGVAAMVPMIAPAVAEQQQRIGDQPEAMNMRLVGYNDLQARAAYSSVIHKQGGRYIAYIGHHGGTNDIPKPINKMTGQDEFNGTSVVDVTDPAHPVYLKHIPGAEGKYEGGGGDGARVRRQASAQGRSCQDLHAARVRRPRA